MHGMGQGRVAGNGEAWMWVTTCVGGGTALLWAGKRGRRSGRVGGGRDAWEEVGTRGRRSGRMGGGQDVREECVVGPRDQGRMGEAGDMWIGGRNAGGMRGGTTGPETNG